MMKYPLLVLIAFVPLAVAGQQKLKLAPPKVREYTAFFLEKSTLQLEFALDGAEIWYFKQGDSLAEKYTRPLVLEKSGEIKIWTRHPDFENSDTLVLPFFESKYFPAESSFLTNPDSLYAGTGAKGLFDLKQGSRDLHDGSWSGFRGDSVVILMSWKKKVKPRMVLVSEFDSPSAWIWPASGIEVFGRNNQGNWEKTGEWKNESGQVKHTAPRVFQTVSLGKMPYKTYKILVRTNGRIPANFPGEGSNAWLFIDEILFQ